MTPRFWPTLYLLAGLAPSGLAAQHAAHCTSNTSLGCAEEYFDNLVAFDAWDEAEAIVNDDSRWVDSEDCNAIRQNAFADLITSGNLRVTTPAGDSIDQTMTGAHITVTNHVIALLAGMSGDVLIISLGHEVAHHLRHDDPEAELLILLCLKEEEEDDPGGGDPGTTETCEDVWVPPLTTTVPVFIPAGNCPDSVTEPEECDFGTAVCTGNLSVHVCPGRWVDQIVVLRDGYTERVCTSN